MSDAAVLDVAAPLLALAGIVVLVAWTRLLLWCLRS